MTYFPDLVRRETQVIDFLRTENFDVAKAAKRLALYWKYRKEIFEDRWLLPMTQTGTGALSMTDLAMLRTGYCAVFSRPEDGMLIIYDHSRLQYFDSETHMRISMYLCTVFTDPVTQSRGGGCVYVVQSNRAPPTDISTEAWEMLRTALPVKPPRQFMVAQAYEEYKEELLNFLGYQHARTAQFRSHQVPDRLVANSMRQSLSLLQDKGIDRQYVPGCLGGDFQYDRFNDWVRMRLSIEEILSTAPLQSNQLNSLEAHQRLPRRTSAAMAGTSTFGSDPMSSATSTNTISGRSMSAVYSKRAYERRKEEHSKLRFKAQALRMDHDRLSRENARLEELLRQAKEVLSNEEQHKTTK